MSHTSQRRGLDYSRPGEELIVLAMVPSEHRDKKGVGEAMAELGVKMLEHGPDNWILKNASQIYIPKLGPANGPVKWMHKRNARSTERLLMRAVARLSTVITAVYTDSKKVRDLLDDIQGVWLETNRRKGHPISIVVSGLFHDIDECCRDTGPKQHTYLHSIGFHGRVQALPDEDTLELVTMCGHGLVAANRIRHLVEQVKSGIITAGEAAEDIARPCVCGIVNAERARDIFNRMARS